jgi:hypothetical protein
VALEFTSDEFTALAPGALGVVDHFDATGTMFCRWDNGSRLGLVFGQDRVRLVARKPMMPYDEL